MNACCSVPCSSKYNRKAKFLVDNRSDWIDIAVDSSVLILNKLFHETVLSPQSFDPFY